MTENERRYVRSVVLLTLDCAMFWAGLYLLMPVTGGVQKFRRFYERLGYFSTAGFLSFIFIAFFARRIEKRVWGTTLWKREKLTFSGFGKNFLLIFLFNLLSQRLVSFLTDLLIEHRYAGSPGPGFRYSPAYDAIRLDASRYLFTVYAVLMVGPLLYFIAVRDPVRRHREQDAMQQEPTGWEKIDDSQREEWH